MIERIKFWHRGIKPELVVDGYILFKCDDIGLHTALLYLPPSDKVKDSCGCFIFAVHEAATDYWIKAPDDHAFININNGAAIDDLSQAISELEYKYEEDPV